MINILIADNQQLILEGISSILSKIKDIGAVGKAATLTELNRYMITNRPDVVIIDHHQIEYFNLPVVKSLYQHFDPAHILILSNSLQRNEILTVLDQGIKNYICKSCSKEEFLEAVFATANGKQFYCRKTSAVLFGDKDDSEKAEKIRTLSYREKEIVELIAKGMVNKDIAEQLFLSVHTVRTHRKNIIKKLGFTFKHASELILVLNYLNGIFI